MTIRYVCVYCASSNLVPQLYLDAAQALGSGLVTRGWGPVYGGVEVGLMGTLARAVHSAGGRVVGIIPRALLDREVGYRDADELIVTGTLRERKQLMDDRSEAYITLPGGFGTLEELIENLTLKQLGYHHKPVIIVNVAGYFDHLLAQFERIFVERFSADVFRGLYSVVPGVDAALDLLEQPAVELPPKYSLGQ